MQSGRGSHLSGELGRLDEAVVGGTTRSTDEIESSICNHSRTRRDSGEQPAMRPAGWGAHPRARRWATYLEGALSHSAHATPSGERSMMPAGPSSPGRIGACRTATQEGPAESVSWRLEAVLTGEVALRSGARVGRRHSASGSGATGCVPVSPSPSASTSKCGWAQADADGDGATGTQDTPVIVGWSEPPLDLPGCPSRSEGAAGAQKNGGRSTLDRTVLIGARTIHEALIAGPLKRSRRGRRAECRPLGGSWGARQSVGVLVGVESRALGGGWADLRRDA